MLRLGKSPGHGGSPLRDHLRAAARLGLAVVVVVAAICAWQWHGGARRADRPRENLAVLLAKRYALRVAPPDIQLPTGLPRSVTAALRYRPVFFLGRKTPQAPRDVYWLMVRFSPAGVPLATRALVNLSRTPAIDEQTLVSRGPFVAFPIQVGDRVGTIVVIDTRGEDSRVMAGRSRVRRITAGITNYQETGHLRGYARHSLEPRRPVRGVTLRFTGPGVLEVRGQADKGPLLAGLDVRARRLSSGSAWLRHEPPMRGDKPLFNWLVDTVRNISWVGPKKIEYLQYLVYSFLDLFRRKVRRPTPDGMDRGGPDRAGGAVALDHDLYRPTPGSVIAKGWPPPPLKPLITNPPRNEGRWFAPPRSLIHFNPGAPVPLLETFIHPDPKRPYSGVGVLLWDPRQVQLGMVAGTREPESTTGLRGRGLIPRDQRLGRLIAAFNGGFQTTHGEWGMMARGRLIREPMQWAATVAVLRGGSLAFGTWERGDKKVPPEVVSFRQNLAPLLEDGVVNPLRNQYWGVAVRTYRERIHIVRSGICLTREGFGAYLWGKAVSLKTLTRAMQMARCQYGMQLDINRTNASAELYRLVRRRTVKGDVPRRFKRGGRRSFGLVPEAKNWVFFARSWLPGMYTVPFPRFVRRDWRDFFYLTLRSILPGAHLRPVVTPPRPGEGRWSVTGLPQGGHPFPPRLATTFVRPDPGAPAREVRLVKLDPRRLAYRSVPAARLQGSAARVARGLALWLFGNHAPPGLQVAGQQLVASSAGGPALLVERPRRVEGPPTARIGPQGSTRKDQQLILLIGGAPLGGGSPPAPVGGVPTPSPRPVPGRAGGAPAPWRASGLAVDRHGHVCYAVTSAGPAASRVLQQGLTLAGCGAGIRLPDRPHHGPLVLGPVGGRFRLLPGEQPVFDSFSRAVAITSAPFAFSKRLVVGVAHRPDRVLFSISKREAARLFRQRQQLQSGMTPRPRK